MATTTTTTHNRRGSKSYSRGKVPFAWENKPGVSKPSHTKTKAKTENYFIKDDDYKLPPPPTPKVSIHGGYQLPLPPPYTFLAPISRSSSIKGLISNKAVTEDPFQVAIFECTKSIQNGSCKGRSEDVATKGKRTTTLSLSLKHYGGLGSGMRSLFGSLSCRCSSSGRDDSLVKVSRNPYQRDTVLINF